MEGKLAAVYSPGISQLEKQFIFLHLVVQDIEGMLGTKEHHFDVDFGSNYYRVFLSENLFQILN